MCSSIFLLVLFSWIFSCVVVPYNSGLNCRAVSDSLQWYGRQCGIVVTIVNCHRIDRRFEPGLWQCSPPPASPDRGLGPLPLLQLFYHSALINFHLPGGIRNHVHTAIYEKNVPSHLQQCAPPPPTHDGRLPPHPLLCPSRCSA